MDVLRGALEPVGDDVAMFCVTEVIISRDSRPRSPEMKSAKAKELTGFFGRGSFQIVLKGDVPEDANIFGVASSLPSKRPILKNLCTKPDT